MSVRARLVTLSAATLAVPLMAVGLASTARADTTPVKPVSPPKPAPSLRRHARLCLWPWT
jgi:hypothetical protein